MSDKYMFDVEIAKEFGLEESVMIYNFKFWIDKNTANNVHFHDGKYWTYNSHKAFVKQFPFWTPKQIRRILKSLSDREVIMTSNFNKAGYDRTLWYSFTDKFINEHPDYLMKPSENEPNAQMGKWNCPNGQMDMPEWENGDAQKGKPIPYINTYNNNIYSSNCSEADLQDDSQASSPTTTISNNDDESSEIVNTLPLNTKKEDLSSQHPTPPKSARPPLPIEKRMEQFRHELDSYVPKYGKPMIDDFYNYWSEPMRDGKKMKCEKERTWDTSRRLDRWLKNDKEYHPTKYQLQAKRRSTGKDNILDAIGMTEREFRLLTNNR